MNKAKLLLSGSSCYSPEDGCTNGSLKYSVTSTEAELRTRYIGTMEQEGMNSAEAECRGRGGAWEHQGTLPFSVNSQD